MPATRNARKKNKFEPSSSQASRKQPHKRVNLQVRPGEKVHDKQVAMSADDAYKLSKLADAQTPISPVPVTQLTPLTSSSSSSPSMAPTAKPLKGRKRFSADLHELHTSCPSDLDWGTWSAQSFRAGDDDGSVEFDLIESRDRTRIVMHLLCSDTSEYPNTHSFFCHSPEPGSYGEQVKEICDGGTQRQSHEDDHNYDMTVDEDLSAFTRPEICRSVLRRDFEGTYAAGYNPGAIWSGSSEFFLTISVPVVELTDKIPAHVLMSWDSQFLRPRQHLVLVISGFWGVYPPVQSDGTLSPAAIHSSTSLKFYVGLSRQYKPSKEHVVASLRRYGLQSDQQNGAEDGVDEEYIDVDKESEMGSAEDDSTFDKFSLSSSLESLLDEHFLQLLRVRRQFKLGWAAAEELHWRSQELQTSHVILVKEMQEELRQAEEEERRLAGSRYLPHDPLETQDGHINLLETAFAYLLRRFTLCNRYCVVCHKKLDTVFEALKPYVCNSGLCAYQYYSLNFGPSLEYDICKNTEMVDLLVSLAYVAAAEQVLDEPLPRGLLLKVPDPVYQNPMRDFDSLAVNEMRTAIVQLINTLPPIRDMKKHLEKKVVVGTNKPKLKDMDPSILPAAWSILRWCVASCTAHLQELTEEEDQVQNIGSQWRQFRFMVGAPDKEAKFKYALEQETCGDSNAKNYPTLYAFHGSPLRNWHSIIRHGLWYKTVANGRVYFAKDGVISMGSYATGGLQSWKNSTIAPSACVALAEIINLPQKFTSYNPYYVVKQTEWIMCRYLLVNTFDNLHSNSMFTSIDTTTPTPTKPKVRNVPFIKHDPNRRPLLSNAQVEIPQPSYKLEKLLGLCQDAYVPLNLDEDDSAVFNAPDEEEVKPKSIGTHVNGKPKQDWVHDASWVEKNINLLLPPPADSTPGATMALQKEFRAMMKEQGGAESLATLGWYMPPEFNENLFQWVVEMHSFDPDLPIAKDLKSKGVNSLVFEIRFPSTFPHSPPFFRLVMPRFLPFMQGGGGHITVGGSICMDLLTSAGWLPSYNIASVLLQIKLAISSTDPKPARLDQNWEQPYHPQEALSGYTRAAAIHGWKVANPREMERLVTQG
ncbi:hypothetical protein DFJ58DRAFT_858928 [Suillus subalutaceus]|uniref:uncharacterized protein n=1 Tax=Suillus subalutaceus TaxID=48586 RepID=UPI001B860314|nr:uncharacterized protein DFJ58DRAFT_858928 [Suillus subalutaceus]KAG1868338.1 hypothetical protein DFJ58DRAFT_858928 [Suillus subalutaceus]